MRFVKFWFQTLPLRWYALSVFVLVLDQITKMWASKALDLYELYTLTPFFDFTLRYNTGAAFSFLAGAGGWQRWFLSFLALLVSVIIIVWMQRLTRDRVLELLGLALILGGALGNVYDRLSLGYVIDFILFHWQRHEYPAFNIADSAIFIGACLLIYDALFLEKKRLEKKRLEKKRLEKKRLEKTAKHDRGDPA